MTDKFRIRLKDENSALRSQTLWPVCCREFLFLPEFKVDHGELEEKFEAISYIAKGSFGTVYKVRRNSEEFALKVLEKSKVVTATDLSHNNY